MDIEQKQAEHIDYFVKQASNLKGSALRNVIVEATSHPSLFAFAEILSVPNILEGVYIESRRNNFFFQRGMSLALEACLGKDFIRNLEAYFLSALKAYTKSYEVHAEAELQGTENAVFLDLLRVFAHGTWSEYKSVASRLPPLVPDQVLKLKQLTVLTLAETNKVLAYDVLIQELDVTNVRELEDFLINDCMYVGIVRGKLDQLRRCFEVQFAAGRDPRPGQLGSMIQTIANWLSTSDNLLVSIQEKIKWADNMSEMDKKHRKEVEERVEEVKKTLSFKADTEFRGHEEIFSEHSGVMDYEEDRSRPKRRRHPLG